MCGTCGVVCAVCGGCWVACDVWRHRSRARAAGLQFAHGPNDDPALGALRQSAPNIPVAFGATITTGEARPPFATNWAHRAGVVVARPPPPTRDIGRMWLHVLAPGSKTHCRGTSEPAGAKNKAEGPKHRPTAHADALPGTARPSPALGPVQETRVRSRPSARDPWERRRPGPVPRLPVHHRDDFLGAGHVQRPAPPQIGAKLHEHLLLGPELVLGRKHLPQRTNAMLHTPPGGAVMRKKKRPVGNRWRPVGNRWRLVCNRWRLVGSHQTSESGCHSKKVKKKGGGGVECPYGTPCTPRAACAQPTASLSKHIGTRTRTSRHSNTVLHRGCLRFDRAEALLTSRALLEKVLCNR